MNEKKILLLNKAEFFEIIKTSGLDNLKILNILLSGKCRKCKIRKQ